MGRLEGKRALCTASGAGIGRATALAFAAEGAHVIATDINAQSLEDLTEQGIAEVRRLDVRDSLAVKALAKDLDAVDVLFNGVGWVHSGSILECSDEDLATSFDLNVTSMHRTIAAFLPGMVEKGGGSIVNVASVCALKGLVNRYAYSASKAAVSGLTKAVAADFVGKAIRCNAIAPGTVQSPSLDERIAEQAKATGRSATDVRQSFIDRQPMGRLGTAEEIAAAAVYLASDESRYTTGTVMVVDGGLIM